MREQNEASVEEILESIKKVIARDNQAEAISERRKRKEEGVVNNTARGKQAANAADANAADGEILDLGNAELIETADEAGIIDDIGEADGFDDDMDDLEDAPDDEPLITDAVRNSMRDNLAALAMLAEPGVPPQIVRSGETSLEGLTREMLRPMLAQWLDANLPGMVEKMVKDEIARIAGKRS